MNTKDSISHLVIALLNAGSGKTAVDVPETIKPDLSRYLKFRATLHKRNLMASWHPETINVNHVTANIIAENSRTIIFNEIGTKNYFSVPLAYLEDPAGWESDLIERIITIEEMAEKVSETLPAASSHVLSREYLGYEPHGAFFHLVPASNDPETLQNWISFIVHYESGEVYNAKDRQKIAKSEAEPVANVKKDISV